MRGTFEDKKFGLVLDKGTLDALHTIEERRQMLEECQRILKPNGLLVSIAFSDPKRLLFLDQEAKRLHLKVHTHLVRKIWSPSE
jgi:ubiquinone/menaquinone biosynthesis C-methylase UbiE